MTTRALRRLGCASALALAAPALGAADYGDADVLVRTGDGLEVATMDGAFGIRLNGRLMFDTVYFQDDRVDFHSGTEIRRARLDVSGTVAFDWDYRLEVGFANDEVDIADAWLGYRTGPVNRLRVGQFKAPMSLEEQTSSLHLTFLERALPNALVPDRRLGLGLFAHSDRWTLAAAVVGSEGDTEDDDDEDDEGWGAGLRATVAPLAARRRALHLGMSANYHSPGQEESPRIRARPEAHITDTRLVDTDDLEDIDHVWRGGLEAAAIMGPWSAQGEFLAARFQTRDGVYRRFHGGYAYVSYFLTGENRDYQPDDGEFGRIDTIIHGYGAWEIALRWSQLDLQDADIDGGRQENWTLAVNWYPARNLRFMLNHVRASASPVTREDGNLPDGTPADLTEDKPNVWQLRAQVDF
ncbi:porin [Ectothiorhodospiraceae bacterium WFHF3C12]|nr:porin [Ectothiorhodospiraceae bacterium WFHF3C12]